jgi:FMN-dependent NADH-azoreductase
MLGFLGMTDVEVIRIEGTALGPEAADKALTWLPGLSQTQKWLAQG